MQCSNIQVQILNYDFVENNPVVQSSEYQHYLVSPAGIEYELEDK